MNPIFYIKSSKYPFENETNHNIILIIRKYIVYFFLMKRNLIELLNLPNIDFMFLGITTIIRK